jgi:hypothetical protein
MRQKKISKCFNQQSRSYESSSKSSFGFASFGGYFVRTWDFATITQNKSVERFKTGMPSGASG